MALQLYYRPSFLRSVKGLERQQQEIVGLIIEAVKVYYASGCNLPEAQKKAPRFFYKQLRKPYHEAGIERTLRVVIKREGEKCLAVLAGNHNQIRKFLDNV